LLRQTALPFSTVDHPDPDALASDPVFPFNLHQRLFHPEAYTSFRGLQPAHGVHEAFSASDVIANVIALKEINPKPQLSRLDRRRQAGRPTSHNTDPDLTHLSSKTSPFPAPDQFYIWLIDKLRFTVITAGNISKKFLQNHLYNNQKCLPVQIIIRSPNTLFYISLFRSLLYIF
jgi:hypothetical protein